MAEGIELIRPDWPAPARVRAAATTRAGGTSGAAYRSLNLGAHVGDDPAAVSENRLRFTRALGLAAEPLWLDQVHGAAVAWAGHSGVLLVADAMIADRPLQACVVLTADCLPVLLCDDAGTRVAAVHAGWRGLAAGVLEATLAGLVRSGVTPDSLMAWLGPAISAPSFEVGSDVRDAFLARDPAAAGEFEPNARGRWQFDLPALARRRLVAAGVKRVSGGELCTHGDPGRFFSYRRDGSGGRQATVVWLED